MRRFSGERLRDFFRISVGTPEQTDAVVEALNGFAEAGARVAVIEAAPDADVAVWPGERVRWLWRDYPLPVVFAFEGRLAGAAAALALGCDIRVCGEEAALELDSRVMDDLTVERARALLGRPDLMVLDEPMSGVDVNGQAELYAKLRDVRDRTGCGVLLVSHDLHLVMAATDTVICLNHHICCTGHAEAVIKDPAFAELFGERYSDSLAVYHHHHDHAHDAEGHVVPIDTIAGDTAASDTAAGEAP